MLCLVGRALWFGAVSSQRAFDGLVSVSDGEVTPSLFVASPLMPSLAGAIVAALRCCDEGVAWPSLGFALRAFSILDVVLFLWSLTHRRMLRLIVPSQSSWMASPILRISWAKWDLLEFWNGVLV